MKWLNILSIFCDLSKSREHVALGNTDTVEAGKTVIRCCKAPKRFWANVTSYNARKDLVIL
jgi:hypothetical protein